MSLASSKNRRDYSGLAQRINAGRKSLQRRAVETRAGRTSRPELREAAVRGDVYQGVYQSPASRTPHFRAGWLRGHGGD